MLCLLSALLVAAPVLQAQPSAKVQRVGILVASSVTGSEPNIEVFRRRLGELGYREGQNINFAQGTAAELVALKVDAILAVGADAGLAAKEATRTIPIVFVPAADPVAASLAEPGGNITGFTQPPKDVVKRLFGQLKDVAPKAKRVAVLVNTKSPGAKSVMEDAAASGQSLGVKIDIVDLPRAEDAAGAFAAVRKNKADALIVTLAAPIAPAKAAELALKARLPAIHERREFVAAGGLMSYGAKQPDMFRLAAGYVVRVLKGAKPADLPAAQPGSYQLAVNLKTAKTLRLTIPQSVLTRADEVIN